METPLVCVVDDDDAVRLSISLLVEALGLPVRNFPSAVDMLADSDGQQEAVRRQTHFLPAYTAHAARPATINLVTGRRLDFPPCDQKPLFSRATVRAIDDRGPPHAG